MERPRKPKDEIQRLAALKDFDFIDSSDASFEEITTLLAHVLDTPMATISLVTDETQRFVSKVGLAVDETPRDISFCGHAVYEKETLLVPDASTDERFLDNPLVTGAPNIQFYVGEPLIDRDGHALGTLCALDRKPRTLTDQQLQVLKLLAKLVMRQLEQRLLLKTVLEENRGLKIRTDLKGVLLDKFEGRIGVAEVLEEGFWFTYQNHRLTTDSLNLKHETLHRLFQSSLETQRTIVAEEKDADTNRSLRLVVSPLKKIGGTSYCSIVAKDLPK